MKQLDRKPCELTTVAKALGFRVVPELTSDLVQCSHSVAMAVNHEIVPHSSVDMSVSGEAGGH